MAFPVVQSTAGGATGVTQLLAYTASLPGGIQAGDRIVLFVMRARGTQVTTWPAGWTQVFSAVQGSGSFATRLECRYRDADGTEGASIELTTTPTESHWAHRGHRISGHDPANAPAGATALNTINPPNLDPAGWGAEDTLWLAVVGHTNASSVTGYPANYTNGVNDESGGSPEAYMGSARRNLNAASEDPGTFTIGAVSNPVAAVVAIAPTLALSFDSLIPLQFKFTVNLDSLIPLLIRAVTTFDGSIPVASDMCKILQSALLGEVGLGTFDLGGKMNCLINLNNLIPLLIRIRVALDSEIPITISVEGRQFFDHLIPLLIRKVATFDQSIPIQWSVLEQWVRQATAETEAWMAQGASESDVWTPQSAAEPDAWTKQAGSG